MPKLSDFSPDQVKVVSQPQEATTSGGGTLRLSQVNPDHVKVVSTPPPEEDWVDSASRTALKGIVTAGRAYDKYLTAPTRAAHQALIEFKNPFTAFGEQFGKEPELAPSGTELARQHDFSEEKITTPFIDITGKKIGVSPAQAAGAAINILDDPLNVLPLAQAAKIGGKAIGKGAELAAEGIAKGAGALGGAVLNEGVVDAVRNKLASALGNIPKEKVAEYMARPVERVNAARPIEEIGRQVVSDAEKLQKAVSEGSAQSYRVLERANGSLGADDIAQLKDFAEQQRRALSVGKSDTGVGGTAKAGIREVDGVIADIEKAAGSRPSQVISSPILDASGREVRVEVPGQAGTLNYVDAKKILQNLDSHIQRAERLGDFDTASEKALIQIRGALRQKLGERVPEFNQVMAQVSADTQLLKDLKAFGDLNTVSGRLEAAAKEHRHRLADQETLDALGKRFGTDYVTEVEDRLLLDSFGKDANRGSRYQVIGGTMGAAVARALGLPPELGIALGASGGSVLGQEAGGLSKALLDSSRAFKSAKVPEQTIGEAIKEIRLTPRFGLEKAGKVTQVFSATDALSGAEMRREAIRRRLGEEERKNKTPRLGE